MNIPEATVVFPVSENSVILGKGRPGKKFGANVWNGFGGSIEPGESVEKAAVRELFEEAGLTALQVELEKVAEIVFVIDVKPVCKVHFFITRSWNYDDGTSERPNFSDEFTEVKWFDISEIPRLDMMSGDTTWVPRIFEGMKLKGSVFRDKDGNFIRENLRVVEYF